MKAAFLVSFCPMTRVVIECENPDGLTDEELFQQAEQFSRFLTSRHYRSPVLRQKLSALLNQTYL